MLRWPRDRNDTDVEVLAEERAADHSSPADDGPEPPVARPREPHSPSEIDLLEVRDELRQLRSLFEKRLRYDSAREEHFNQLYQELDGYKRDAAGERMLGLARALLLVIDKLEDEADERLRAVAEELDECLATADIHRITDTSALLTPREEQVVGFLDEDSPEDRRVAAAGYRYGDRVVRPRRVLVRRDVAGTRGRR